ncbi:hypothetical protein IPA_03870 [Ignicoccus pacificus DSM 13166]|uniref:Membrane transport protein MMPL domain-containing protein n=1 Tax=Ignicoccus pacificus DSM 13166 TaxID=940294 RepID=A0A977KB28_9CREN|nr:hypothetical protein IPA_03870 [Ignicoccus pacificus DSM 13166]
MKKYTAPAIIAIALIFAIIASRATITKTSSISMILSPNAESMKVSLLTKSSKTTLSSNAVLIIETKEKYSALSPKFYRELHGAIYKYGLNVSMDYYTLRSKIENSILKGIFNYTKTYYPYISYLKSLVNQLDAVSFYVIGALESAWKLKLFLVNLPKFYHQNYQRSLEFVKAVNHFEKKFYYMELNASENLVYAEYNVTQLLYEIKRAYELFIAVNKAFSNLTMLFKKALYLECSNGTLSIRFISNYLEEHSKGLANSMAPVFSGAVFDTALVWPGNLTSICKKKEQFNYFVMQVLARFISIAPNQMQDLLSHKYLLPKETVRALSTLALSIGPNATRDIINSALSEALRVIFNLDTKTTTLALKAINGDREAFASLVILFSGISDPCLTKVAYESLITNTSFTFNVNECELQKLRNLAERYAPKPYDPSVLEAAMAYGSLNGQWAKYLTFYTTYMTLLSKSIPPQIAYSIASTGEVKNLTKVLYIYLNNSGTLYAKEIAIATATSKDFEHARRKALLLVFSKFAKEMVSGGLSPEAVSVLLNYLLAWSPGLTNEMINEIVYKTALIELQQKASQNPFLPLINKVIDLNSFIKKVVWCNSLKCALEVSKEYGIIASNNFMEKYVTLDVLVGKDGKHLIVMLSGDVTYPKVLSISSELKKLREVKSVSYTGRSLLNTDIQRSVTKSLDEINKIATIFVLIALLFSTRSLKLSIIPVIIIYIVLQYYKVLVLLVSNLIKVYPSSIDLIVATATILGMGIDYSLYAAHKYSVERSIKKALRPVLLASSMASTGFIIFGLLSVILLPSLATLGLFIPLAIMFTATVGPLLTFTIVDLIKIQEEEEVRKIPFLTAVSIDFPKLTIFTVLILAAISLYVIRVAPPGYDLFLFLPSNAPSAQGLKVLQDYSSPGITGPTVVLLKLKQNASLVEAGKQVESLIQYFLEGGYFDHAFTFTRPLGKFISYNPEVLKVVGGFNYIQGNYIKLYLLPHYPPDSNKMIEYIKFMRQFIHEWLKKRGKAFDEALVGGESAMNYDLSTITNTIILNYILPSMILIMAAVLTLAFQRPEFVVSALFGTILPMIVALGAADVVFKVIFHLPLLWVVAPLLVTTVLSVGSDYLVFYLFGIKESFEECKLVIDGECLEKLSVLLYSSAKLSKLIMGFATTFAVAYFALLVSNIWALKQIGLALGLSALLLLISIAYTLVPAVLSLAYRRR